MPISSHIRLRPPAAVTIRTFDDGESVLLHTGTAAYFSLNATGTRMWQALTTAASFDSAYQMLLATYPDAPATLRGDLERLAAQLLDHHLLEAREP
jgi:hypothetical protein